MSEEENNTEMMMQMMQGMMQGIISELVTATPENDSVREQANVLAVYLIKIRKEFEQIIDAFTLAKLLYNLKQSEFDKLYAAFEAAKQYRRVL